MPFQFRESHIVEHRMLGYTVFRQILPASLLGDLRRACAKVHEIARASTGPRAMRLTGVQRHGLDCQAFRDYAELPALRDAVQRVLTPQHVYGDTGGMAILIQTADIPVCQSWHRDVRESEAPKHAAEFRRAQIDPLMYNQINCPLYEDNFLWFVPGSHLRHEGFAAETAAIRSPIFAESPGRSWTNEEREQLGLQYCRAMPGAVCLAMDAGDFALYNPLALHLGNIITYKPRATIHDTANGPTQIEFVNKWHAWVAEHRASQAASPVA